MSKWTLANVRVFDGSHLTEPTDVSVENAVIRGIGARNDKAAEVVDGGGAALLPGLIDAHTHADEQTLRQALTFGVTTEFDLLSMPDVMIPLRATVATSLDLADVRSASFGLTTPEGHPHQLRVGLNDPVWPTVSHPDQAQGFVDGRIAEGADYIKILIATKDKLEVRSIDEVYKNGEEFLNSLSDGATGGDYQADDWKEFGKSCLEKLSERRDQTKEISEKVFVELAPEFQKRIDTDFKTLFEDPDALDRWNEEINSLFEQINSGIENQEKAIAALATGPYKETATETMATVRTMLNVIKDQYSSTSKEAQDEMNKD